MAGQSRIHLVTREEATDEQRRVGDFIYLKRNEEYLGPSAVLLQVPRLAEVFEFMREHIQQVGLPADLLQLATLVLARHWSVDYIWNVRAALAKKAGISDDIIDAIAENKKPAFKDAKYEAIYTYVRELLGPVGVSDVVHEAAKKALGSETMLIELVALVGMYTFLAFQCRAADIPVQTGGTVLSK